MLAAMEAPAPAPTSPTAPAPITGAAWQHGSMAALLRSKPTLAAGSTPGPAGPTPGPSAGGAGASARPPRSRRPTRTPSPNFTPAPAPGVLVMPRQRQRRSEISMDTEELLGQGWAPGVLRDDADSMRESISCE